METPASDWQNPILRWDVSNDGFVSPIDALMLINYINSHPVITPLPLPRPVGDPFYDVTGDGLADPRDVLEVINRINQLNSPTGGEGEGPVASAPLATEFQTAATLAAQEALFEQPREQQQVEVRQATAAERTAPEPRQRKSTEPDSIRIDRYGLEDVLDSIAADVGDEFGEASPLDEILAEMLG